MYNDLKCNNQNVTVISKLHAMMTSKPPDCHRDNIKFNDEVLYVTTRM